MSLIDGPNSSEALNSQYFEFRSALANAKHIIVLAGAGLSAGSGEDKEHRFLYTDFSQGS